FLFWAITFPSPLGIRFPPPHRSVSYFTKNEKEGKAARSAFPHRFFFFFFFAFALRFEPLCAFGSAFAFPF
ncbi:hypothetical protein, partial [Schaalia odontolytica]|uniref:hypothetical protein n=1 Tax=Schaalia odontolytica TaxID=1660 RepID=UPI00210C458C